jgi:hypothetical protein
MILTKEDNDIIVYHLYKYGEEFSDIADKMAMDFYINTIEFLENETILKGVRIKPVPIDGVLEENIGKGRGDIGDYMKIKLSEVDGDYIKPLKAAIREIKLKKII